MKQFALYLAASFVAGVLLVLLVIAGVVVYGYWDSGTPGGKADQVDPRYVENPQGFRITKHAQIDGVERFTVQGIVENDSPNTWYAVQIIVAPHIGGAQISQCEGTIYGKLLPHSRRAFQVECDYTSAVNLPQPVSYELRVASARKG
jgi:hypothetical protein